MHEAMEKFGKSQLKDIHEFKDWRCVLEDVAIVMILFFFFFSYREYLGYVDGLGK